MDKTFKEKFLRGSATTFIGQASSMVFHFVSIMILTRVISKADFGVYALILVVINLFLILSALGLDVTLVKFISGNEEKDIKSAFKKIFTLRIISLTFFALIFLLFGEFFLPVFSERITDYLFYIPVLFFLGSLRDLTFRILQGFNYFRKYAITQIFSAITRLLLIVLFHLEGILDLDNLIIIEIISIAAVLVVAALFVPFKLLIGGKADNVETKEIMNFSLPIYFNNIFTFLYGRINLVIIGALLNPISVAFYSVGNKMPAALQKMFASFILVLFPNLSSLFSNGEIKSAEQLINKSLNVIAILFSIVFLIAFLFSSEIVVLLFSEKYEESSLVFSLLMLNLFFSSSKNILGYSNLAAGYPKVSLKINIFSVLISVGGSLLMIPQFGYIGVALALIAMNIFAQVFHRIHLKRIKLNISIFNYLKPILFLIITVGVYLLLSNESIVIRILCILIYLTLNWFLISDFKTLVKRICKFNF